MDDNIITKRTSVPLIKKKKIEAAEEYLHPKRDGLFGVKELAQELNLQPTQIHQYAANLRNHQSSCTKVKRHIQCYELGSVCNSTKLKFK